MNKYKLIGHNYTLENLINLYKSNNFPNKILLSGKKGIGKSLLVSHLLNYIYSKDEELGYDIKNFEINTANKTYLLLENNSHPNVLKIFKKKDKKNIEISQIREIIKFQNHSSFNNKIKFIIVDDVEYMNLNSTNALLKSIEEPNNKVHFILINNSEKFITDTLKSRCLEFKLFLKYDEIKLIVNSFYDIDMYNNISNDFLNHYNSPSFLISLVDFFKNNNLDLVNITIENFLYEIIKNKYYDKDKFINDNLSYFIELYFYKHINLSRKVTFRVKEYFYLKLSLIKKYNLDLESFFLEFKEKLLRE